MSRWHDDRGEVDYQYNRRGGGGGGRGRGRGGGGPQRSFRDAEEFGWKRERDNDRDYDRGYRRDRERSPPRGGPRGGGGPRGDRQPAPGCSVFVGNLSYRLHWQELKDHMRQAGDVTFVRIMEGQDGRSKGCGIVEYSNKRDTQRALDELHDSDLAGRPLMVREDREEGDGDARERPSRRMREQEDRAPREDRGGRRERGGGGGERGGRGGRRERKERPPKQEVTSEMLDDDLDSYFKAKPAKKGEDEAPEAPEEDANDALEDVVDAEEMQES